MSADGLAECTSDIDNAIVTAWRESWRVAGVDPEEPPDPDKSNAALEYFLREHHSLVAEVARRYRQIIEPEEDLSEQDYVGFCVAYWLGEHVDKLNDSSL